MKRCHWCSHSTPRKNYKDWTFEVIPQPLDEYTNLNPYILRVWDGLLHKKYKLHWTTLEQSTDKRLIGNLYRVQDMYKNYYGTPRGRWYKVGEIYLGKPHTSIYLDKHYLLWTDFNLAVGSYYYSGEKKKESRFFRRRILKAFKKAMTTNSLDFIMR